MKWLLLLLILLINATASFADEGEMETFLPREIFGLPVHLTNNTGEIVGASCQVRIMNSTYSTLLNDDMTEIGNGWYNYTYNTSKVGTYFCVQNCTLGDQYAAASCDFIIGSDETMALGIIILIPLFITAFLLAIAWMLDPEKYWALRLGFILLSFFFIIQAFQYSVLVVSEFYGSNDIINAIADSTLIFTWIFRILFFVVIFTFIMQLFMMFSDKKKKTGDYVG